MSFLDDIEDFLARRGKPIERRGKLDCTAFLAYSLNISVGDYDTFTETLRAETQAKRPRLEVLLDAHDIIVFIGIRTSSTSPPASPPVKPTETPVLERSSAELVLEEVQVALYMSHHELEKQRERADKAQHDAGEHLAELRQTKAAAQTAEAKVAELEEQFKQTSQLRATAQEIARLTADNKQLRSRLERAAEDARLALASAGQSQEALNRFKKQRDDHICSVPLLNLIHTGPCGCAIIADHRQCTGERITKIDVMPHGRVVNIVFLGTKSQHETLVTGLAPETELSAFAGARFAKRHMGKKARQVEGIGKPKHVRQQMQASTYTIHALGRTKKE
ncbi:MAG TPA: hypothetical protein VM581_02925 [Magnetospirillaceae bacterium]|nr:hypothetical protein [Magnetospirillaceae bacterium]